MTITRENIKDIFSKNISSLPESTRVYERSFSEAEGTGIVMVECRGDNFLLAQGAGIFFDLLEGEVLDEYRVCPLTTENRKAVNHHLPFTRPVSCETGKASMGLGDRLGIATAGHIDAVRNRPVFPVFAQQSIRELTLTGRSFDDVLDAAAWSVLREGYHEGYGADADHLKEEADIRTAVGQGISMLTLDCSDRIDNAVEFLPGEEIERLYARLPEERRKYYEEKYAEREFRIGDDSVSFSYHELQKYVLLYSEAVSFIRQIYHDHVAGAPQAIDFEVSIDETETSTTPGAHFLVAREIIDGGVRPWSMAPRFCGEFQKGIDYRGDLQQFQKELALHAAIAGHFGYRLSIHSGSDKFSVFPLIGKETGGLFHVKTAGTSWLEAVRTVAEAEPSLYRKMHRYALEYFEEATRYYHVTTDLALLRPLESVNKSELPDYMNEENARQLMHITYGLLLQAGGSGGKYLFRDEIFSVLRDQENRYRENLRSHIGRHLDLLGISGEE